MSLTEKWCFRFAVGAIVLTPFCLTGDTDSIVLKDSNGICYLLPIESDDRFVEVMQRIGTSLAAIDPESNDIPSFRVQISNGNISATKIHKKINGSQPRDYSSALTDTEIADITSLVRTLANESLIKLKSKESSLKKIGDRVDHIHPLLFLYCIFSNEELKVCIRNIQGRSWVGKSFMDGLTSSLSKENSLGNLMPFVQDFATRLNVDINTILPTLQAGQWEKFVDVLIKTIPRQGNTGRYDL